MSTLFFTFFHFLTNQAEKQAAKSEEMREKGVETKNADGSTRKRTTVKKLGSIAKAWQMHKALKEVDAGK